MANDSKPIVVMAIAGFDPSGGAGVLADIKTIAAFGCYGVAAITSLTLQNTQGVFGAYHQSGEVVRGQLEPLFDDFEIAAIKTGMLPTVEVIEEVARAIETNPIGNVVVDPVVRSTSGYDLISDEALAALTLRLFPLATLVTPNAIEAERITSIRIKDCDSMERAAEKLLASGARAVLVKGGHIEGDSATDILADGKTVVAFTTPRVKSKSAHGTGCTLASALACLLARGFTLGDAVNLAKRYITDAITNAPRVGRGSGPVNHFPTGRNESYL
ncbi:MAG TPA: bifunctional hydroxymethylpyrimidine kinase/phosphomethylpyrimidine kinase [Blastocatellia bacterium]|nr:bifunctional hydroxymethylpyrimidine kinase/phosphomethylpyrimidine kinase [Blastocatellia bacterium]